MSRASPTLIILPLGSLGSTKFHAPLPGLGENITAKGSGACSSENMPYAQ